MNFDYWFKQCFQQKARELLPDNTLQICTNLGSRNCWCSVQAHSKFGLEVHYEIIKRNWRVHLEFHIDSQHRELNAELVNHLKTSKLPERDYIWYGNHLVCRRDINSVEDMYYDLETTFHYLQPLIDNFTPQCSVPIPEDAQNGAQADTEMSSANSNNEISVDNNISLGELLGLNDAGKPSLNIPHYQRGYCWRKRNIIGLLDSIHSWLDEKNGKKYHLGSIIVKGNDVIDGQQRLLTLAILCFMLDNDITNICKLLTTKVNKTENARETAQRHLVWAKRTIADWCDENFGPIPNEKQGIFRKKLLQELVFCLIKIPDSHPDDLAYTFFNTTNTTGKPLSDYDLLKTHHLRFLEDEGTASLAARQWNHASKADAHRELLHLMLFRLRHWIGGEEGFSVNADSSREHYLFQHYKVSIEPLKGLYSIPVPAQIDSILAGGMEFFNFVESYRYKLASFNQFPVVRDLERHLSNHSKGVLCQTIKALAFLYYCKFGELYLPDAIFCCAYKVSVIRNETRVMQKYLAKQSILFSAARTLNRVTLPGEFFAWALEHKSQYKPEKNGHTRGCYWNALHGLFKKIEPELTIKTIPAQIISMFNPQERA